MQPSNDLTTRFSLDFLRQSPTEKAATEAVKNVQSQRAELPVALFEPFLVAIRKSPSRRIKLHALLDTLEPVLGESASVERLRPVVAELIERGLVRQVQQDRYGNHEYELVG
jgi:hypothetical protein